MGVAGVTLDGLQKKEGGRHDFEQPQGQRKVGKIRGNGDHHTQEKSDADTKPVRAADREKDRGECEYDPGGHRPAVETES